MKIYTILLSSNADYTMSLKYIWYSSEALVAKYLEDNGCKVLHKNRTIRWWEIDMVVKKDSDLVFVEVKNIDHTDDIHWYITYNKLKSLKSSIDSYIQIEWYDQNHENIRLIFVFVKDKDIVEFFEYEW